MNPKYPLYIVSKGRWNSRLTSNALEKMKVPYYIIIEKHEYKEYSGVIDKKKILILNKKYQDEYDTFDDLGNSKSKGPGAARNFAWDHSIKNGFEWHWVMDDNIRYFARYNKNKIIKVYDGTIFRCMEDFVNRYENVYMAGPNYFMFVSRKEKNNPIVINTRIYSCNLIKNNTPYRWRGRYNEDTDLSLRILKDGYCTIQFNTFLQYKMSTQIIKGGNTEAFYKKEGTAPKSRMLKRMHPNIVRLVYKFNREHHSVNYKIFRANKLKKKKDVIIKNRINNYGMKLVKIND